MIEKKLAVVVDDDKALLETLRLALSLHGFEVLTFSDAASVEASLPAGVPVDALVVDYKLPGTTGFVLLRRLCARARIRRVILITGHGEEIRTNAWRRWGVDRIVEKPIDLELLLSSVGSKE